MRRSSDRGTSRLRTAIGAVVGVLLLGLLGVVLYQRGYVRLNYPSPDEYPVRGIETTWPSNDKRDEG